MAPREALRLKEPGAEALVARDASDDEILAAMAADPVLLQRPIVERGDRAVLARPAERVLVPCCSPRPWRGSTPPGCGGRGQALARDLVAAGHAVRGTTRDPRRFADIEAAGAEPYLGDPDRIMTLMDALSATTIVCYLMGSATGDDDAVRELHGGRLRMLCEKMVEHRWCAGCSTRPRGHGPVPVAPGGGS